MKSLLIVLGLGAIAGVVAIGAYSTDAPVYAKDKLSFAEKFAKAKKIYVTGKEGALYADLTYWIDLKKLDESRWIIPEKPPFKETGPEGGGQLYATLKAKPDGPDAIKVMVIKSPHKKGNSVFSTTFKETGDSVQVSNWKGYHEGLYNDAMEVAKDLVDNTKPKKASGAGPAKMFASITATFKPEEGRVRRDWYGWMTPNFTWYAEVTFHSSVLKKKAYLSKATDLLKYSKEVNQKKLK